MHKKNLKPCLALFGLHCGVSLTDASKKANQKVASVLRKLCIKIVTPQIIAHLRRMEGSACAEH